LILHGARRKSPHGMPATVGIDRHHHPVEGSAGDRQHQVLFCHWLVGANELWQKCREEQQPLGIGQANEQRA
jgi:hypothetical protein